MNPQSTPEAQLLKRELENRGLIVKDEVKVSHMYIDLTIPRAHLNIEVDGKQHYDNADQILSDLGRTKYSDQKGWQTFHVRNDLIDDPIELRKVADAIVEVARRRAHKHGYRFPWHHYGHDYYHSRQH